MASLLKGNNSLADEKNFEINSKPFTKYHHISYHLSVINLFLFCDVIEFEEFFIPRRERRIGVNVFDDYIFYFDSLWKSPPAPEIDSIKMLIILGGGLVGDVSNLVENSDLSDTSRARRTVIIASCDDSVTNLQKSFSSYQISTFKWILDCATCFTVLNPPQHAQ